MKNLFLVLILSLPAVGATAQKIAVKNNLITVAGQPYARMEPDGGALSSTQYYVRSLQGEQLFVIKLLSFNDPATSSPNNPTGETSYVQFVFPASGLVAETSLTGLFRALSMARKLYPARLLKNDALDPRAVADFALVNGTPFSARRQALLEQSALMVPAGY